VDATLGQKLHNIGIGQTETQIPAHGEGDDVVGEAIAAEGRGRAWCLASPAGAATGELTAGPIVPGLRELVSLALLTLHAAPPLPRRQATAYRTSARPNETHLRPLPPLNPLS